MIKIDNILDAEMYIGDVDAVIFDLDDTLYSEKEYVRSGYHKIAEYFGIPDMENEMWKVFESGGKAIDAALEAHGLTDRKEEALKIYRYQEPDIHLYDGAADMIARIQNTKKVGIITDGRPEGQKAKLRALKIRADEIIITDELGGVEYRKPNEAAFKLMRKKLQVSFEKMAYVGDNPQKDFVAPIRLGMKCIYFKNVNGLYSTQS